MALAPVVLAAALALTLHAGIAAGNAGFEAPGIPGAGAPPAGAPPAAATPLLPGEPSMTVEPSTGEPFQPVTIVVRVAPGERSDGVRVTVRDGAALLGAALPLVRGAASITTNGLRSGTHSLTAEVVSDSRAPRSVTAPVSAVYGARDSAGASGVSVTIPRGTLTLTRLPGADKAARSQLDGLDVRVTDTRAGNLGFTVSVMADACSGRLHLTAEQVPGNALRARDVTLADTALDHRLRTSRAVARYPAGLSTGATQLHGALSAAGPSSTRLTAAGPSSTRPTPAGCRFPRAGTPTFTVTAM